MVIVHSYVSLPEGKWPSTTLTPPQVEIYVRTPDYCLNTSHKTSPILDTLYSKKQLWY
jgi:hypothetical protein